MLFHQVRGTSSNARGIRSPEALVQGNHVVDVILRILQTACRKEHVTGICLLGHWKDHWKAKNAARSSHSLMCRALSRRDQEPPIMVSLQIQPQR